MSTRWTTEDVKRFEAKKSRSGTSSSAKPNNSKPTSFALGRMKAGKMNKTELQYAARLEALKQAGEIVAYWFEAVNLRIGENCFYKPDFLVMTKESVLELHEIKGWMAEDALVKMRAIADKYPFPLKMFKLVKGSWEVREF